MRQVALAHERTYLHPPRRSLAERVAGTHLAVPPADRHCKPTTVGFPQRRSRWLVRVCDIEGLADAIKRWQLQEWTDPCCPPSGIPAEVECCNYLELPFHGTQERVHASDKFHSHPWRDAVLTGGYKNGVWQESVWMCQCHMAFLFRLPDTCQDQNLLDSAVDLGKRKGWHIPLMLVTFMTEFWPWTAPQTSACLPEWLRQQKQLSAYTATKPMRDCGAFLRKYTTVKAWIGVNIPYTLHHVLHIFAPCVANFVIPKAWIPISDTREVIQWDHAERKVHLEQGFATRAQRTPAFYWDFASEFWK